MQAIRLQKSSSVTKNAVSETVRRVNAKALALLNRRAEINRRIRSLHRVVEGLRGLGSKPACRPCGAEHAAPRSATWRTDSEQGQHRQPIKPGSAILAPRSWRDDNVGRLRSQLSDRSKQLLAGLSRACRIALVEAEAAASLDEIRSRIDRRGSFAFSDSKFADTEIARTLHVMSDAGEIRCLRIGTQILWERISPVIEIEN